MYEPNTNREQMIREKTTVDSKDIDNTYSQPNIKNNVGEIIRKGTTLGLVTLTGLGITSAVVENIDQNKTITKESIEGSGIIENQAGFPNEGSIYTAVEGDSFYRIAEIVCAKANIERDPTLVTMISDYIMTTLNNRSSSFIDIGEEIAIPAYLPAKFKQINHAKQALPEANSFIDVSDDYTGPIEMVGILKPKEIAATEISKGEKVTDIANSIPGYTEIAKSFPNLALQVIHDTLNNNYGKFDKDGIAINNDRIITASELILVNPNLKEYYDNTVESDSLNTKQDVDTFNTNDSQSDARVPATEYAQSDAAGLEDGIAVPDWLTDYLDWEANNPGQKNPFQADYNKYNNVNPD